MMMSMSLYASASPRACDPKTYAACARCRRSSGSSAARKSSSAWARGFGCMADSNAARRHRVPCRQTARRVQPLGSERVADSDLTLKARSNGAMCWVPMAKGDRKSKHHFGWIMNPVGSRRRIAAAAVECGVCGGHGEKAVRHGGRLPTRDGRPATTASWESAVRCTSVPVAWAIIGVVAAFASACEPGGRRVPWGAGAPGVNVEGVERGRYLVEGLLQCFYCHSERSWTCRARPSPGRRARGESTTRRVDLASSRRTSPRTRRRGSAFAPTNSSSAPSAAASPTTDAR